MAQISDGATKELKFTPLEFETAANVSECNARIELKFTPLEFETKNA